MEDTPPIEDDSTRRSNKRKNPFNTQQRKEEKERRQKKRARVIVRNISFKVTEDQLRKHFEQWGTLEEVNLLKRPDGKLVGCAFLQYAAVNEAMKAILKGNAQALLGRPVFVDWALGKDEFKAKLKDEKTIAKKAKIEIDGPVDENGTNAEIKDEEIKEDDSDADEKHEHQSSAGEEKNVDNGESDEEVKQQSDSDNDNGDEEEIDDEDDDDKDKVDIEKVNKKKHISNDIREGCTVFIKNVPFDATDDELRKLCRKYGPVYYAIINREPTSGHSIGTAFVKFKRKESVDLCLQSGSELMLMDQLLEPLRALSREEIKTGAADKSKVENKDSRNLYLVREGLIMAGSKAADGVSASDMTKRHKLEKIKKEVLKNLNRFVSRNRLSIHNLPLGYDDEKLKQLAITHTGLRPHECRVMRENKITPEYPKGKSKGFGFLSFSTHQDALTALRKLNNNPKMFGTQHRPIVAFSIEDRAVYKMKENRMRKSKLNNPTYKEKLEKRKELRKQVSGNAFKKLRSIPQGDNKDKVQGHLQKVESINGKKDKKNEKIQAPKELKEYVGTTAKPGAAAHLRSNKKILEQAQTHMKRIKTEKRKEKQRKIKQIHLAERKSIDRPKQGRKKERDDLQPLVNKYKQMLNSRANEGNVGNPMGNAKKPKRTKWYTE